MFGRLFKKSPPPPQGRMYELWIKVNGIEVKTASVDHKSAMQILNCGEGVWRTRVDYEGIKEIFVFEQSFDYIRLQRDGLGRELMRIEISIPAGSYILVS